MGEKCLDSVSFPEKKRSLKKTDPQNEELLLAVALSFSLPPDKNFRGRDQGIQAVVVFQQSRMIKRSSRI